MYIYIYNTYSLKTHITNKQYIYIYIAYNMMGNALDSNARGFDSFSGILFSVSGLGVKIFFCTFRLPDGIFCFTKGTFEGVLIYPLGFLRKIFFLNLRFQKGIFKF